MVNTLNDPFQKSQMGKTLKRSGIQAGGDEGGSYLWLLALLKLILNTCLHHLVESQLKVDHELFAILKRSRDNAIEI